MGINGSTTWKQILRDVFPECWHTATDAKRREFRVVVEDLMLRLFLFANRSERRQDLVLWWKSHPDWVFQRFPAAHTYLGIFDGPAPRSKDPERRDRAKRPSLTEHQKTKLGRAAFLCNPESDNSEVFRSVFGGEDKVRSGKFTPFRYFMELYKNTRDMRPDALRFAEHNLVQMIPNGRRVVLDGGTDPRLWKVFASSCPCQARQVDLVGEGDLKLVRALEEFPDEDIWVTSTDTDSIVILLLAMGRELERNPAFRRRIFLDMGNMTPTKTQNVLDVVALWRAIIRRAGPGGAWHGLRNPVETFCAVLISTGTDFFKGYRGVGPKTIWATFESAAGQRVLSRSVYANGKLCVAENRLMAFGRLAYCFINHSEIQDHKKWPPTYEELETLYNAPVQAKYEKRMAKYLKEKQLHEAGKRPKKPREPPKPYLALSEDQMRVRVRMLGWTLAYWRDAHTRRQDTTLCTLRGVSLYGWTLGAKNEVEIASIVASV